MMRSGAAGTAAGTATGTAAGTAGAACSCACGAVSSSSSRGRGTAASGPLAGWKKRRRAARKSVSQRDEDEPASVGVAGARRSFGEK